ncbi:hypothetical protein SAMN05660330_04025 [Desulforhopalus singaporensis]|uniref:Uncharacterized protein n=1 Tax=Desulforhopalus singaporensis TaxID=91360 RepID=A0A1H0VEJ5_9BACT|nr:hypothetical protein SAMN05660330_04025 [Desulforhopalus singaporensis]
MNEHHTEFENFVLEVLGCCSSSWYRHYCFHGDTTYFLLNSHLHDIASRCNLLTKEKSKNRIFTHKEVVNIFAKQFLPSEGYLLENGKAIPTCIFMKSENIPASVFKSSKWYIHDLDPLFSKFVISPSEYSDCILKVQTKHGIIHISFHAWEKFISRIITCKQKVNKFENRDYLYYSRRYCLRVLIKLLQGSEKTLRNNRLEQFLKYNCKNANYYTVSGWILVVEENKVLKTIYHKGKISRHGYKLADN